MTLSQLPERWLKQTHLVVPASQVSAYRAAYSVDVLGVPDNLKGITRTRQWIIENAHTEYAYMIDDDMKFQARSKDWVYQKGGYLTVDECDPEFVGKMFDEQYDWLREGYAAVSLSARQMNHGVRDRYWREVARMNNMYGFRVSVLRDEDIRFDTMEVMEDFHVTLSLLEKGYPNRISTQYIWNQRGSGAIGGCSGYRTGEVQERSARLLTKLHSPHVQLVTRECNTAYAWKGLKTRYDVRISWRKVYKGEIQKDGSY